MNLNKIYTLDYGESSQDRYLTAIHRNYARQGKNGFLLKKELHPHFHTPLTPKPEDFVLR